jgi:hypothetical protein
MAKSPQVITKKNPNNNGFYNLEDLDLMKKMDLCYPKPNI